VVDLRRPRRTSPLGAAFEVVSPERVRNLLPVAIVAISSGRVVLVLVVAGAISLVAGVLGWLRRLWSFDGDVLHLDEGVFVRNQRRIPVDRIQHVELERSLRHQIFGLAAVRVETAGGSGAELRLDAIGREEAEALRSQVLDALRARAAAPAAPGEEVEGWDAARHGPVPPPPPAPREVLVRLPPGRLLLAGITGPEVVAVFASLVFAVDALADFGIDPDEIGRVDLGRTAIALLVLVGVPVWFLVAGLIAVVRKWDLTASISGDELRVTYGLLRKHEFVVRTSRVQDARVAQRLLLRPFGRADLRVRSAASGGGDASQVDIPLLDTAEIDRVLGRVLPAAVPRPRLRPAPPAARRRALVRGSLGALLAATTLSLLAVATSRWWFATTAIVLVLGPLVGELSYRGLGWAEAGGVQHSRSGALARRTAIVPSARVQSAAVVSTLLQRRRGLGSVRLDLASSAVGVYDRDAGECGHIAAAVTAD
jgi:putative membrane protein